MDDHFIMVISLFRLHRTLICRIRGGHPPEIKAARTIPAKIMFEFFLTFIASSLMDE